MPTERTSRTPALYSKDDLTINGSGALEVTGNYRHAIASKDDTVITGGTITVTSVEMPCAATTPSKIGGGKVTVNARDDAFHSEYLFYIADGHGKRGKLRGGLRS